MKRPEQRNRTSGLVILGFTFVLLILAGYFKAPTITLAAIFILGAAAAFFTIFIKH